MNKNQAATVGIKRVDALQSSATQLHVVMPAPHKNVEKMEI